MGDDVDYKKLFLQLANVSDPLILESVISATGSQLTPNEIYTDIWKTEENVPIQKEPGSKNSDEENELEANNYELELLEKTLDNLEASIERHKKISRTESLCKIRELQLREIIKENSHVDIAFLVDCTGSMASYINEVKNHIHDIVRGIFDKFDNKIRLAFVGYRDYSDGVNRIEQLNFTNIEEFITFLENIEVRGGADIPEDVLGGLEAAVNLDWLSKNKIIFHMGDAPNHGKSYHNMPSSKDDYYNGFPRELNINILFKRIKKMNLKYFFARIKASTDKMIKEFKRIGGDSIVSVLDLSSVNLFEKLVTSLVTETIEHTQLESFDLFQSAEYIDRKDSVNSDYGRSLKEYSVYEDDPYNSLMKDICVSWLDCKIPSDIPKSASYADMKSHIVAINHNWTYGIRLGKGRNPFAEGQQRISYHGQKDGKQIVLKEFKYFGEGRDRREDYIQIMEAQAIAAFMAKEFNKVSPNGSKNIFFLKVNVIQHYMENNFPVYYNVETLLPEYKDGFMKWSNNTGRVCQKNYSAILDAFSHWTYDITKGFLLVVDLQGVELKDSYVLTDPSINCMEQRFGGTNIGEVGTELFFSMHECGELCKQMELKKNKYMKNVREICSSITGNTTVE